MRTVSSISRMASTAAPSADSFSPSPTQRAAASAPYSVTRTSSIARLRSGRAPPGSGTTATNLQDARGLSPAYRRGVGNKAAEGDARRAEQPDPVADLDRDVDVVRVVAAGAAEDDPVHEDHGEGGDADDHRHLARPPRQVMPAGDDVGEDERRRAGAHQQDVEDAVGLERAEAAAVAVQRRVRVAALGVPTRVAARREPVQEQREEQDRGPDEADDLRALDPAEVDLRLLLLELR